MRGCMILAALAVTLYFVTEQRVLGTSHKTISIGSSYIIDDDILTPIQAERLLNDSVKNELQDVLNEFDKIIRRFDDPDRALAFQKIKKEFTEGYPDVTVHREAYKDVDTTTLYKAMKIYKYRRVLNAKKIAARVSDDVKRLTKEGKLEEASDLRKSFGQFAAYECNMPLALHLKKGQKWTTLSKTGANSPDTFGRVMPAIKGKVTLIVTDIKDDRIYISASLKADDGSFSLSSRLTYQFTKTPYRLNLIDRTGDDVRWDFGTSDVGGAPHTEEQSCHVMYDFNDEFRRTLGYHAWRSSTFNLGADD